MSRQVVWARPYGKQAYTSLCESAVEAFADHAVRENATAEQLQAAASFAVTAAVCGVLVNGTMYSPHWPKDWKRNWLRIAAFGARMLFTVDDVNHALTSAREQRERAKDGDSTE